MQYCLTLLLSVTLVFYAAHNNPEELGEVTWLRDLKTAQDQAEKLNKPILILFQEIPGCSTCKRYGNEVLSHPLIVEAIESLFVPLAIYNNRKGPDEKILAYYQEPSWNNPVVRIVGTNKVDLLPRLSGQYSPAALVNHMIFALDKINQPVPAYLQIIQDELVAREQGIEKTTLSMYCFWTGEKELGKLDGVVHTEAGFMDGREVVNVYFDKDKIDLRSIIAKGSEARCADQVYASDEHQKMLVKQIDATKPVKQAKSFRPDNAPKYYLSKSLYRTIPMSPLQAVKANVLVGEGKKPDAILSPRQIAILELLQKGSSQENAIHHPDWKRLYFDLWQEVIDQS